MNWTDCQGSTLLLEAADQNDLRMTSKLIASGIDINNKAKYGQLPLITAVQVAVEAVEPI